MITIWTAANTALVHKTFGRTLKGFRPNVPEHTFVPFRADADVSDLPSPQAGEVVLVSGNRPLMQLQHAGLARKGRKVTSLRGIPIPGPQGGHYFVTYDPFIVASEPWQSDAIDYDVRLCDRWLRTNSLLPPLGDYRFVNDYAPLIAGIEAEHEKTGRPVHVSMDLETEGLYPWYPNKDIVSISFTHERGTADVLYLGKEMPHPIELGGVDLFSQIQWLLTSPKVYLRGANAKYDLVWIAEKWGLECTNFAFDTLLAGTLVNDNRSNSLNLHAKVYTPIGGYDDVFNRTYDKNDMVHIDPFELLPYAGGDTDATQQSADVLREELLEDGEMARFYLTILHPASRAFEKIERRGIVIDEPAYRQVTAEVSSAIAEASKQVVSLLPGHMLHKYRDRIADQIAAGKSPMLPSMLQEFFFSPQGLHLKAKVYTAKSNKPSTAKSHLTMFDEPAAKEMTTALDALDRASKIKSSFCDGFLKHLRPDGRLHPTYMLFHGAFMDDEGEEAGSTTGRLSAKEPAIQTLPVKAKPSQVHWARKLRKCFTAPLGKVVLALDYSQGELRVVACIADERTMIKAYEEGLDLHAVTGAEIADIELALFLEYAKSDNPQLKEIYEEQRGRAKPANFGLLYGMSAEGFVAYAWQAYGRMFTLAEAQEIRAKFFRLYPKLLDYHQDMRRLAHQMEAVRSPLGRVRHLPHIVSPDREIVAKAERQGINAPVQSTLTDMMIWAIALIEDAYRNGEFEIFAVIHDAVYAYVDADKVALRSHQAQEIMSNLPLDKLDWYPQLAFPSDAKAGPNLADLDKVPKLDLPMAA